MVYLQFGVNGQFKSESMQIKTLKLAVQLASNIVRQIESKDNWRVLSDRAYYNQWIINRDKNMQSEQWTDGNSWVQIRRYP